jgi:hypothetical protein
MKKSEAKALEVNAVLRCKNGVNSYHAQLEGHPGYGPNKHYVVRTERVKVSQVLDDGEALLVLCFTRDWNSDLAQIVPSSNFVLED